MRVLVSVGELAVYYKSLYRLRECKCSLDFRDIHVHVYIYN
jgi:hypothetical protein